MKNIALGTHFQGLNRQFSFSGLLDKFGGAAAGYSLRKLAKDAVNAVRVRRSSDNTETDIGFTKKGELDTTTLLDFVNARDVAPADYGAGAAAAYSLRYVSDSYTGDVVRVRRDSDNAEADFNPTEITDGTLLAWVGNTASDNGYVTTWYDQSGNSNDASQATAANQPKIVDAGVLVEDNGKAAVYFPNRLASLDLTSLVSVNTFFAVNKVNSAGTFNYILFNKSAVNGFYPTNSQSGVYGLFDGNSRNSTITNSYTQNLDYYNYSTNYKIGVNGESVEEISSTTTQLSIDTISRTFSAVPLSLNGNLQEIIIYPSDQSSNRGNIEANVNDYYSIYTSTNDGFVTTWYDQSGNANNATQATAASQPQIVSAGSIITDSGYEVIQYDGSDDNLGTSLTATGTMLMGGSDGGAFYEVAISGAYDLLANAPNTDHPLKESIRVIWGRTLSAGEQSAIESRVTYSDWDFSDVTSFVQYWRQRGELTSFPLINVSSGTNFQAAWRNCTSLTSFPLLDVSSGTNFSFAWRNCTSLTSFPLLDVSSGTNFQEAWRICTSLTSFPALDVSSGTNFFRAWNVCTSLQDFPANMFDSVTATDFTDAFANTNLTQTSIDNILVSIDTAGQSGGTFTQSGGSAPSATGEAAIDNLRARGWTVTVTGGY